MSETPHYDPNRIAPPPRILQWLISALIILSVLAVVAAGVGVYAFREWVPPRYQSTYSQQFPILQVILPARPAADTTLPTPVPQGTSIPIEMLLGLDVTEEATEEIVSDEIVVTEVPIVTVEVTEEVTEEVAAAQAIAAQPTEPPAEIKAPSVAVNAPTATPVPPTPTPQPTLQTGFSSSTQLVSMAAPPNARNFGFQYVKQTWNNCGPANVTMSLSFYGWSRSQEYAQSYLRGGKEDKNVSPNEIVQFVNEETETGVRAAYRIGGDLNTLRRLVAAELPVMVELGYAPEGNDWLGHYQTVIGYDNSAGDVFVYDSYIPSDQGLPVDFASFDDDWRQFARTFIVFYPIQRENEVMNILGPLATVEGANEVALQQAQQEARENPTDPYALFNLGKAFTRMGNHQSAATAFDRARVNGLPWRMMWYQFEPFEAYFGVGRYSDVLALVDSNITTLGNGYVEETFYWQGRVFEAQGERAQAASSYRRAIAQNSRFTAAQEALERVS